MVKFDPTSAYHQALFVQGTAEIAALTLAVLGTSSNIGADATGLVIEVIDEYVKENGLMAKLDRVSLYDAQQIISRLCLKLHKMIEEGA